MPTFFRDFLLEDPGRLVSGSEPGVFLAMFGKHPAWKDHIDPPFGLSTASLVMAWDRLYENGIGGRGGPITSTDFSFSEFERKTPGELLPGFDHEFVWWRSGQYLAGRMWATSDHARPPRMDYPLIACFQAVGVPLTVALRELLPRLETVPAFCRIRTASEMDEALKKVWQSDAERDDLREEVQDGLNRLQQELRSAAAQAVQRPFGAALKQAERQQFVDDPAFAPKREGLLRVLHQVESRFSAYLGNKPLTKGDTVLLKPAQVRVPVAAPSAREGILRWVEFFSLVLASGTPVLLTAARDTGWIDVTVGEPSGRDFFCLRASSKAMPLTSSIPFSLDESLKEKGEKLISAYISEERPAGEPGPARGFLESATSFFRKEPNPKSGSRKGRLWLVCLSIVALLAAGGAFLWQQRPDLFVHFLLDATAREKRLDQPTSPAPGQNHAWTNAIGMEFVWVPAVPTGGALIGKYKVTQKQFRAVMGRLPDDQLVTGDAMPVANVSFADANDFCGRLSHAGQHYSLPSKAEWLAAAGLSTEQADLAWEALSNRGELDVNGARTNNPSLPPAPTGHHSSLPSELCDLFGNVREWVVARGTNGQTRGECAGFGPKPGVGTLLFMVPSEPLANRETGFRCLLRQERQESK